MEKTVEDLPDFVATTAHVGDNSHQQYHPQMTEQWKPRRLVCHSQKPMITSCLEQKRITIKSISHNSVGWG